MAATVSNPIEPLAGAERMDGIDALLWHMEHPDTPLHTLKVVILDTTQRGRPITLAELAPRSPTASVSSPEARSGWWLLVPSVGARSGLTIPISIWAPTSLSAGFPRPVALGSSTRCSASPPSTSRPTGLHGR